MKKAHPAPFLFGAIVMIGLVLPGPLSLACSVPVFRFALEYWHPEPYQLLVFYADTLTPEQRAHVDALEKIRDRRPYAVPFVLERINVNEDMPEDIRGLWEAQESPPMPWLALRYPAVSGIKDLAWSGRLGSGGEGLVDSPVRRELARRLTDGETAVWLFIDGEPQKDAQAQAALRESLQELEKVLKLPHQIDETDDEYDFPMSEHVGLEVRFSVLEIERDDPDEAVLLSILEHADPGFDDGGEARAFAVFGQGRVLLPLVGKGIYAENVAWLCRFLAGPCSCQVKGMNPGLDLLTAFDWQAVVSGATPVAEALPPLTVPVAGPLTGEAVEVTDIPAAGGSGPDPLLRNLLIVAIVGCAAVAVGVLVVVRRQAGKQS